jgi:hypothetical protein
MTFSQYSEYVKQKGHFSVQLNDHRGQPGLDEACEGVLKKWVHPFLSICRYEDIFGIGPG